MKNGEKIQRLVAGTVDVPAVVRRRSVDAAHNEFATDIHAAPIVAAEDVIEPRSAPVVIARRESWAAR